MYIRSLLEQPKKHEKENKKVGLSTGTRLTDAHPERCTVFYRIWPISKWKFFADNQLSFCCSCLCFGPAQHCCLFGVLH